MGAGQSGGVEIGGSSMGYQVLRVYPNSPGSRAGLKAYFDFIVAIGNTRFNKENGSLREILKASVDQKLKMIVYNTRTKRTREVEIVPSTSWGGNGLLGVSIKHSSFDRADERVWHVVEVEPNSPAHQAGFIAGQDYVIGSDSILQENDDLYNLVETHEGKALKLFVYNVNNDNCREVICHPNSKWGGKGYLGCEFGHGLLHRIPYGDDGDPSMNSKAPLLRNQHSMGTEQPVQNNNSYTFQNLLMQRQIDQLQRSNQPGQQLFQQALFDHKPSTPAQSQQSQQMEHEEQQQLLQQQQQQLAQQRMLLEQQQQQLRQQQQQHQNLLLQEQKRQQSSGQEGLQQHQPFSPPIQQLSSMQQQDLSAGQSLQQHLLNQQSPPPPAQQLSPPPQQQQQHPHEANQSQPSQYFIPQQHHPRGQDQQHLIHHQQQQQQHQNLLLQELQRQQTSGQEGLQQYQPFSPPLQQLPLTSTATQQQDASTGQSLHQHLNQQSPPPPAQQLSPPPPPQQQQQQHPYEANQSQPPQYFLPQKPLLPPLPPLQQHLPQGQDQQHLIHHQQQQL